MTDSHVMDSFHFSQTPVKLLAGVAGAVVVYSTGAVGMVGSNACSLAPSKKGEWSLVMAEVSCNGVVCVVGAGSEVTVGIAESADKQLGPSCIATVEMSGADLLSGCICQEKLLLLCE